MYKDTSLYLLGTVGNRHAYVSYHQIKLKAQFTSCLSCGTVYMYIYKQGYLGISYQAIDSMHRLHVDGFKSNKFVYLHLGYHL